MSSLLVTKEYIKQIYAKNQVYIDPVLKFMLAMIVFLLINLWCLCSLPNFIERNCNYTNEDWKTMQTNESERAR